MLFPWGLGELNLTQVFMNRKSSRGEIPRSRIWWGAECHHPRQLSANGMERSIWFIQHTRTQTLNGKQY
jgi:hypothetical protein